MPIFLQKVPNILIALLYGDIKGPIPVKRGSFVIIRYLDFEENTRKQLKQENIL